MSELFPIERING